MGNYRRKTKFFPPALSKLASSSKEHLEQIAAKGRETKLFNNIQLEKIGGKVVARSSTGTPSDLSHILFAEKLALPGK